MHSPLKMLLLVTAVLASVASGQQWERCIGAEITKCLSCVLEATGDAVKTVVSACDGAEFETVSGVLETLHQALECIEPCKAASTQLVAQQCSSWYCQTDFCVTCCGEGRQWQCGGNDFHAVCAPRFSASAFALRRSPPAPRAGAPRLVQGPGHHSGATKVSIPAAKIIEVKVPVPVEVKVPVPIIVRVPVPAPTTAGDSSAPGVADVEAVEDLVELLGLRAPAPAPVQAASPSLLLAGLREAARSASEAFLAAMVRVGAARGNAEAAVEVARCRCGPGSGDPDSCCTKCHPSSNPHNVPHCAGGGMNTGAFCVNDFHAIACYGDTPLCCTNDVGMPACCREGQRCHSPLVGPNSCI